MTLDIKHFVLSHLIWIALAGASIVGFNSWKTEHDARLIADQQVKISQVQVQSLQQQIADRDKQAVATIAPVVKIIHDTVTVPQAVAALPQVLTAPLPTPIVPQSDNSVVIPEPDVIPLFDQVADDKICRVQLDTTTKDLTDTKAIVDQKDTQIKALTKKPSFWHRVGSTMKKVGIGVAIGLAIAKYI